MTPPKDSKELRDKLMALKRPNMQDFRYPIEAYEDDLVELIDSYSKEFGRRDYLSHFHYDDWEIGDDDKLRVGDYISCDHQRPHDGYEQTFEGQIVEHHDNSIPVILYNIDPKEPDNSGDYADLQELYMGGWTFARVAQLSQTVNEEEKDE